MYRRIACALTLAAALAVPAAAGAASKPFTVVLSPSSVTGSGPHAITAAYSNKTTSQSLGSSNLTVPAGLTATGATGPAGTSASVNGNVVKIRNFGLAPKSSKSVTITVTASPPACGTSVTRTWSATAKQSNDYNGTGNDFNLQTSGSSLTTSVAGGACAAKLRFSAQPANVLAGQAISATAFDPSGAPLAVELVDAGGNRVTSATAPVSVALGTSPAGAVLSGTKTVNAVNGVASFSGLSVDKTGAYRLVATSTGITGATSNSFDAQERATECPEDQSCSDTVTNGSTSATITAFGDEGLPDESLLIVTPNGGARPDCAIDRGWVWAQFDVTSPNRRKLVSYGINRALFPLTWTLQDILSSTNMCFAAPYQFPVKAGTTLAAMDRDGDGTVDEYVGTLPDCTSEIPVNPCVSARRTPLFGNIEIDAKVPASPLDPKIAGYYI